jgi:hypothetical protein
MLPERTPNKSFRQANNKTTHKSPSPKLLTSSLKQEIAKMSKTYSFDLKKKKKKKKEGKNPTTQSFKLKRKSQTQAFSLKENQTNLC